MIFKSIAVVAVILLLLVCAVSIWAVRILSQKLIYKEETIKELHRTIDDYKYELISRPEKVVYKESLTTPKVCKRCSDETVARQRQAVGAAITSEELLRRVEGLQYGYKGGNGGDGLVNLAGLFLNRHL